MERARARAPWNAQPYLQLGALAFNESNFAVAASHYRTATQLLPSLASNHYNAAVCARRAGASVEEADLLLRGALHLAPTYADALYQVAAYGYTRLHTVAYGCIRSHTVMTRTRMRCTRRPPTAWT